LNGHGRVRVNNAGCLDRCDDGPVVVVYPEDVWYRVHDEADVDAIIAEHVQGGKIVERLRV
jgi:(2Fe-2S) ferredoxin